MRFQINSLNIVDSLYKEAYAQMGYDYQNIDVYGNEKRVKCIQTKESYKVSTLNKQQQMIYTYLCPHCGVELFGEWNYYVPKNEDTWKEDKKEVIDAVLQKTLEDMTQIKELKKCPYCSELLSKERGFYLEYCGHSGEAKKFAISITNLVNNNYEYGELEACLSTTELKEMRNKLGKKERDKADIPFYVMAEQRRKIVQSQKKFPKCESNIACKSSEFINSEGVQEIKDNPLNLKDYIYKLIKLEMNLISLRNRLSDLYKLQVEMEVNEIYEQKQQELLMIFEKLHDKEIEYRACLENAEEYKNKSFPKEQPIPPTKPVMKQAGIFNKKKIMEENEALQKEYQLAMKAYEEKLQEKEQFIVEKERMVAEELEKAEKAKLQIANLKEDIKKQVIEKNFSTVSFVREMIDKEVAEAEDCYRKIFECKERLYAYGIVYEKYQNDVVALSAFYEYLMAGRCEALEGAHGAYNIYEAEIKANTIIGQLTQVIAKLDQLIQTQYMICSELQNVNKSINQLNSTMNNALTSIHSIEKGVQNISSNTEVIAYNTAVTAYYSKINAELTDALGYMIAYK